jgi:hypothetical protein
MRDCGREGDVGEQHGRPNEKARPAPAGLLSKAVIETTNNTHLHFHFTSNSLRFQVGNAFTIPALAVAAREENSGRLESL